MALRRSARLCKTLLPGFGLPLNHVPKRTDTDYVDEPFPNALNTKSLEHGAIAQSLTTLRELTMLQFMNSVTDKPDWHIKVNDEAISRRWKKEALDSGQDITRKMVDWCISELRYKASLFPPAPVIPPPVFVYNGDVYKSDFAVSKKLKGKLQEAVIAFENKIPEKEKDWHPDPENDKRVCNLVHPSLFPLIYGRTRVLSSGVTTLSNCIQSCGKGDIAPVPPPEDTVEGAYTGESEYYWPANSSDIQTPFSAKFQWLPCEVDISGEEAKITSYINNLHPKERQLYNIISKLIDASIPMWELSLAPLRGWKERKQRISFTEVKYDPDPEEGPETEGPQQESDEDEEAFWERRNEWFKETQKIIRPEPGAEFQPLPMPPKLNFKERYGSRGLQVIVKLANIELTPGRPEYQGGTWHVEGQLNEHIVATSLYYYSSSNVTASKLAFRQQSEEEDTSNISYRQDHHDWLEEIFGCENEGACLQDLGNVETREGRLLTFPNSLQHRVESFKLADPKKPGHRKIVALFLVDPNIKVISTANVPCQRQDWLERPLAREDGDFPIGMKEAKRLRLELMEERKIYKAQQAEAFEKTFAFSLCEH